MTPDAVLSSTGPRIAICEDDGDLRELLQALLSQEGFCVWAVGTGCDLNRLLAAHAVDLVILDWMLPGEDGLAICRRLRRQGGPMVLMLTARDGDEDRIAGLDTGAIGYISKPFNPRVLVSQVRAALRASETPDARGRCVFGEFRVDAAARRLFCGAEELVLTTAEFDLLMCFVRRPQRVLTRESLLSSTRGRTARLFDRTIDNQVSRLRAKLSARCPTSASLIRTVRSAGYMLTAPVTPE